MNKLVLVILMILDSVVGAYGALQLKMGAEKITLKIKKIHQNFLNKKLIYGVFLYGASFCLFVFLLKDQELSMLYPLTSITYIFTILFSYWILRENITKYKIIAVFFIILGNVFITIN